MRKWRPLALLCALIGAVVCLVALLSDLHPFAEGAASFLPFAAPLSIVGLVLERRRRNGAVFWLLLASLMVPAGLIAREWLAAPGNEVRDMAGGERIVIVLHNLAKANRDPEGTLRLLLDSDADILLLQEAGGAMRPLLPQLARDYRWRSKCPPGCDMMLFSRLPTGRARWRLRDGDGREIGPQAIWAEVYPGEARAFKVATVHLPWPVPGRHQVLARGALLDAMGQIDTERLIIAGDFNLTPWGAGMRGLDSGMAPMRRVTRGLWSFPARLPEGAAWPVPFLPIDHLFAGPHWAVEAVERLGRSGSDHYPIRVVLRGIGAPPPI